MRQYKYGEGNRKYFGRSDQGALTKGLKENFSKELNKILSLNEEVRTFCLRKVKFFWQIVTKKNGDKPDSIKKSERDNMPFTKNREVWRILGTLHTWADIYKDVRC